MSGNIASLWLELSTIPPDGGEWPLHRYALTARHVGRLNGVYLSRRGLPTFLGFGLAGTVFASGWIWSHGRISMNSSAGAGTIPLRVNQAFLAVLRGSVTFPIQTRPASENAQPRGYQSNQFQSRRMYQGHEQTVALDWALTGIEPMGMTWVSGSTNLNKPEGI